MANLNSIQTAWYLSLLFGAGMGSVLVLRWFWERINLYSEMAAMAASLLMAPVILLTVSDEWVRLFLMSAGSTLSVIIATLITPETEHSVLDQFFRKVNPPGFWGKTASKAGVNPRANVVALGDGLYTVLTTALTIFLLLIGIGKLLVPHPFGSPILPWLFILSGVASVKLWWRRVMETGYADA